MKRRWARSSAHSLQGVTVSALLPVQLLHIVHTSSNVHSTLLRYEWCSVKEDF